MRAVLLLVFLCIASLRAGAQEPLSFEAVVARYLAAQSYCDQGKKSFRDDPKQELAPGVTFDRCARRDGRFKYAERHEYMRGADVVWADERQYYRYSGHNGFYKALSFEDASLFGLYREPAQRYAVFVLELFTIDRGRLPKPEARQGWVKAFQPNAALSSPEVTVFERTDPYGSERISVRNADRAITRFEYLRQGALMRVTEITAQQFDRPLADADLRHSVAFFTRFSLSNSPAAFVTGLFLLAPLVGGLFWGVVFARTDNVDRLRKHRGYLWRVLGWAAAAIALLLATAAAATWGGSGHPPAIVFVALGAVLCAIGFGLAALFLLASYPAERLVTREMRRLDNQ